MWKREGKVEDIDCDADVSATWERGESTVTIENHTVTKEFEGRTVEQIKSLFRYTIKLKRNPKTAIIYVILPTVLITIFNIISAWLPTGQGNLNSLGNFYWSYQNYLLIS